MNIIFSYTDIMHTGKKHSCETQLITVILNKNTLCYAIYINACAKTDKLTLLLWNSRKRSTSYELLKCKLYGNGIGGKILK